MHFSVAVFTKPNGKTVEELLGQFEEEASEEYMSFLEIDQSELDFYKKIYEKDEDPNKCKTLKEYILEDGYVENEEGKIGYYCNPNAQWDWYEIGGRYSNMIIKKDGTKSNVAKLKDIDWDKIAKEKEKQYRNIWNERNKIYTEKNGTSLKETVDEYVARMKKEFTYAMIVPNGNWTTLNDDIDFYEKYVKCANQEMFLTIVDCHF